MAVDPTTLTTVLAGSAPVSMRAPADGLVMLILFAVPGVTAAAWSIVLAVRHHDPVPILFTAGAMLAVLNEATFDLLGHIWYAGNSEPLAWTMLGRPIPAYLLLGFVPFVGLAPVYVARLMARGVRRRVIWFLAAGAAVANIGIDVVGESTGHWAYYAEGPLRYITTPPVVGPMVILSGWLLLVLRPRLRGWRVLALVLVPPTTLAAAFAGLMWPVYAAMNIEGIPLGIELLAGATTLGMAAGLVQLIAGAMPKLSDVRAEQTRDSTGAGAGAGPVSPTCPCTHCRPGTGGTS